MQRRPPIPLALVLAILAILVAGWWLGVWIAPNTAHDPRIAHTESGSKPSSEDPPPSQAAAPPSETSEEPPRPSSPLVPGGKSEMTAYRIAVRNGTLSLEGAFRLFGDFHVRRAPPPWMPAMWCVRLLDGNMRVLAEDTARAPDAVCIVLDPRNPDADGHPQATQFSGLAEEAMLQIRLPPHPDARWLRVYRIASLTPSDWAEEPGGELLASFPLP